MTKRLTNIQKKEILQLFEKGSEISDIAHKYKFSNSTIIRQLKNMLGIDGYQKFKEKKSEVYIKSIEKTELPLSNDASENLFFEIVPLTEGVELSTQKDLSSLPLKDINFPNIVYMIVDKGLELETKFLKDFPEWQFLPKDDLNRKVIQIYFDQKNAKRDCTKDQKVIKVPNTNVFNIVSPILISRGITRIICEDKLIAL